jgi:hypothetical protein
MLAAQESRGQVQVNQALPLIQRHVLQGHIRPSPADIVDQNVKRPMFGQRLLANAFASDWVCHIGGDASGIAAQVAHIGGGLFKAFKVAGNHGDVGSGIGKPKHHFTPQAAAAAGYKNAFAIKAQFIKDAHPHTPVPPG